MFYPQVRPSTYILFALSLWERNTTRAVDDHHPLRRLRGSLDSRGTHSMTELKLTHIQYNAEPESELSTNINEINFFDPPS